MVKTIPGGYFFSRNNLFSNLFFAVQPGKKVIIAVRVNPAQRNDYTYADVQLACLVFFISASANIAAVTLQLRTQLFLRQTKFETELAQIIAHAQVTPQLLLHSPTPVFLIQCF